MNTRRRQTGFTIVEAVIAVVIVAGLVGLGWAVYQRTKQSATTTDAAQNPSPTNNQPSATTPAPTVSYLSIKEWGIKIALSDSIKDAYYVPSKDTKDGVPTAIWLSRTSLTGTACNPGNNNQGQRGAIGAIWRALPTDIDGVTGELLTKEYLNGTTIGNYYYFYQSWATDNPCASKASLDSADTAFASAVKATAEPTTN